MKVNKIEKELIFRYLSGSASEKESKKLFDWLDQDERNKQVFVSLKKMDLEIRTGINDAVDEGAAYTRFITRVKKDSKQDINIRLKRIGYPALKYAALVILILSLGLVAYFGGRKSGQLAGSDNFEIHVPYGGKSSVILPDGSNIWLNAGSNLRYNKDFNSNYREVFLEGEALFDVEKNDIPFIVHTSHLDIHVMGTTFNVKSYPDEDKIETTLIEGDIRIEIGNSKKLIHIKPNQQLRYKKSLDAADILLLDKEKKRKNEVFQDRNLTIYEEVDVLEAVSWQSGELYINEETLESLVKKLERKFDVSFRFEDEELKNYSYSGTLRDFPLEQVLEALKLTSQVNYTVSEKTVKLYLNNDINQRDRN